MQRTVSTNGRPRGSSPMCCAMLWSSKESPRHLTRSEGLDVDPESIHDVKRVRLRSLSSFLP
eukprot:1989798-Alexandrium_andersonii.AAC.1